MQTVSYFVRKLYALLFRQQCSKNIKNVSLKDFQLKDVTFPACHTVYEKCSLLRHQNFRQGFQDIESSNIKKYLQNQPFMDKNANINEPLLTMVYKIFEPCNK